MSDRLETFDRREVTDRGFEARYVQDDSVEYLWHLGCGLKTDRRDGTTTLITDPAMLPEGPWRATELGALELGDPALLDRR